MHGSGLASATQKSSEAATIVLQDSILLLEKEAKEN